MFCIIVLSLLISISMCSLDEQTCSFSLTNCKTNWCCSLAISSEFQRYHKSVLKRREELKNIELKKQEIVSRFRNVKQICGKEFGRRASVIDVARGVYGSTLWKTEETNSNSIALLDYYLPSNSSGVYSWTVEYEIFNPTGSEIQRFSIGLFAEMEDYQKDELNGNFLGYYDNSWAMFWNGKWNLPLDEPPLFPQHNNKLPDYPFLDLTLKDGDLVTMEIDKQKGRISFYSNGIFLGTPFRNIRFNPKVKYYPAVSIFTIKDRVNTKC